jgi:hypothetical protein
MKKIAFTRPDGGVSVVNPAPKFVAEFKNETGALDAIIARDVPVDASDVQIVDTVPADRTFRDAWRQSAGVISVDMAKARTIHSANITAARRELARDLLEREMLGEDVMAEKVALQLDVTAEIDAALDPDTLKAIWPAGLARL